MITIDRNQFKKDVLESLSVKELATKYGITWDAVRSAISQLRAAGEIPKKIVKNSTFTWSTTDVVKETSDTTTTNTVETSIPVVEEEVPVDPFKD